MFAGLTRREEVLLIIFVVIAVISFYYIYLYKPLTSNIKTLERKQLEKQEKLKVAIKLTQNLSGLEKKYELLEIQNTKDNYKIQTSADLLKEIKNITSNNGVKLLLFKPVENEKDIKLSFKCQGDFNQILMLLNRINKWKRQMEYRVLKITPDGNMLNINLGLVYHKQPGGGNSIIGWEKENYYKEKNRKRPDYYQSFKNPFFYRMKISNSDEIEKPGVIYRIEEKNSEEEVVKNIEKEIPFILKGIISNGVNRFALIKTAMGSEFVRANDEINDFKIIHIYENIIVTQYKNLQFEILPGGDVVAADQ